MLRDKKRTSYCIMLIMTIALLLCLQSVTIAQRTIINGKVFQKQNGKWFQLLPQLILIQTKKGNS